MPDYTQVRLRLLELHKSLLDAERVSYERLHGRVTANAFFHAVTTDPSLAWLGPLTAAIVRLDELLDLHKQSGEHPLELSEHMVLLRDLLRLDQGADAFGRRYGELVQRVPEVAFAHAALARLFA